MPSARYSALRQLPGRVGQILGGERDDTESEKREEGQRDARHDVGDSGVAREREQVQVEVGEGGDGEHREDPDDDDHDHGLRSGYRL